MALQKKKTPHLGGERGFRPTASGDLQGQVAVSIANRYVDQKSKSNSATEAEYVR
jgi:hypothetical protein